MSGIVETCKIFSLEIGKYFADKKVNKNGP